MGKWTPNLYETVSIKSSDFEEESSRPTNKEYFFGADV